uniref:Peptidase M12A domain-containing protein n=1 Tax=Panagrolaimus sp. PS1159 TaxID=55785 RepID=A0AC35FJQ5_9BILA
MILFYVLTIVFVNRFIVVKGQEELWPNAKIPYIIDNSLKSDTPQLYALLTSKAEIENQTCVKFYPRKSENDYVHFLNNGDKTACWNIFDKISGPNPVNVGPECLQPFGVFNDEEAPESFTVCDIAYLNEIYQCDSVQYPIPVTENECPKGSRFGRKLRPSKTFSPRTATPKWPPPRTAKPKWPPPRLPRPNRITPGFPKIPRVTPRPRPQIRPRIATTKSIDPATSAITVPGKCNSACMYFGNLNPFYRSVNEDVTVVNHFYTDNRLEQSQMLAKGYMTLINMGFLGQTPVDPACGCLKPLYRLYNELFKDTLLTTEEEEKIRASTFLGYKYERTIGYCTSEPGCGAYVPLYRLYNAFVHDHMYITQQNEMHYYKSRPALGYGIERVECYVWEFQIPSKACEN